MNIELKPYSLITLDYRTVEGFQGALKDLSEKEYRKLKNSLQSKGKFVPEYVFQDTETGAYKFLDGHQRFALYNKENATFNGSYEVPFLLIQADSEKDAKEKLLLLNSQYGKVTKEGFDEFTWDLDAEFILDSTTFDGWLDEDIPEPDIDPNLIADKFETYQNINVRQIVLYFEGDQYEDALARLQAVADQHDLEDNSSVVVKLLEVYEDLNKEKIA